MSHKTRWHNARAASGSLADTGDASDETILQEAYDLAAYYSIPIDWALSVAEVAYAVGGRPEHLARVIHHESRFNTTAQFGYPNGSPRFLPGKATGLIQFLPSAADALGTTTADIYMMSFEEQMDLVEEYLTRVADGSWAGGEPGPLDDQYKMALAVFYPGWRNRPPESMLPANARKSNPGVVTIGDYVDRVLA